MWCCTADIQHFDLPGHVPFKQCCSEKGRPKVYSWCGMPICEILGALALKVSSSALYTPMITNVFSWTSLFCWKNIAHDRTFVNFVRCCKWDFLFWVFQAPAILGPCFANEYHGYSHIVHVAFVCLKAIYNTQPALNIFFLFASQTKARPEPFGFMI